MKIKLSLQRAGGRTTDLVVTADATATVGDVAATIARSDPAAGTAGPASGGEGLTLRARTPEGTSRVLRASAGLVDAGLRAGSTVAVVPASERFADAADEAEAAAARLRVLTGPDAGLVVDLPRGASTVGRGAGCDVRLSDPAVSKQHARIAVGDVVEVWDTRSANGVLVGDGPVQRAILGAADVVVLGDTSLQVERLAGAGGGEPLGATVPFNRSPRLEHRHAAAEVEAPAPPEPARPGRFPVAALLAPLMLGPVIYFVGGRNPLTLLILLLSPVILLGSFVDNKLSERRRVKRETREFAEALAALREDLAAAREAEGAGRRAEVASTGEAVAAGLALHEPLWTRRPEHDTFLTLSLGLGTDATRTALRLPPRGRAVVELWRQLEAVREEFATVDDVPLVADLREAGALGVAGPRAVVDGVARGLVAQLACLHSPAELVLTGMASAASAGTWDWLKWLPHVASPHSPLDGPHLASAPGSASALLTRLEELVAARGAARATGLVLPAVVLVVEDDAPVDRGRLVRLAEEGPAASVHVLWLASSRHALPAVCRVFLEVDADDGRIGAGFVRSGARRDPVRCEALDETTARDLARRLAPVVDAGAPVLDETDLPRAVSYLALAGPEVAAEPMAVVEAWRENGSLLDRAGPPVRRRHDAGLRALVGQGSEQEFVLDLRTQGPHALVGGTTGAGKSEFLQAWVLGMAAAHSPDRVTFLFVDYKGGAAFADSVHLPHSVGLVTDLSPHLVRRALTSLRAELRHRERLLNRKKAKDLAALERAGDPEAPPSLVIVVDEFAALVSEVPEFVDGVVDVAQRGRSLGLHLILATQRPAGVIKDNLRANTNLRVALRMADESDSTDVLGSTVAAGFDPAVPGRGAVRTGPGRLAMFQTGYVGGRTESAPAPSPIGLESLAFGAGEAWDVPQAPDAAPDRLDEGPTDIARAVRTIAAAASAAGVPAPRRPWLPELAPVYDLALLSQRTDAELVLGVVDDPAQQAQRTLHHRPDVDGSIVVFGTGGSGKSTVLRTLATAAGITPRGGPVHVYGLDFGAGGLAMLQVLPHVGDVVEGSDDERVVRLLRQLRETVDERASRYAAARAGSIAEYRRLAERPDEPRVLLLLDGLGAFRDAYESTPGRGATYAAFQRLVAEGRPLGVHVAMSAERPGALPTSLAGSVQRRLVLRQADENAYSALDVPRDVLGPDSPPGRGVLSGHTTEVQVAVFGGTANTAEQAQRLEALAEAVRREDHRAVAPPVRRLPSFVPQSSLPEHLGGLPVLGLADDTLEPVAFEPRGAFVLAGLPGSGRSTSLAAMAAALRRSDPGAPLYYVGSRRSPVAAADLWTGVALSADEAAALARELLPVLREPPAGERGVTLVIESIAELLGGPAEQPMVEAVRAARRNDHFVLAESETSTWGSAWPLVAEVRNGRRGLVLQPDHLDGDALFRTAFPRMARAEFPPGRGVVVEAGRLRRVQLPMPDWSPRTPPG